MLANMSARFVVQPTALEETDENELLLIVVETTEEELEPLGIESAPGAYF